MARGNVEISLEDCRLTENNGIPLVVQLGASGIINRCIICNNAKGILVENASFEMNNCLYIGNERPGTQGAAMSIFNGATAILRNNTFSGNDRAVQLNTSSTNVSMFNNIIAGNLDRDLSQGSAQLIAEHNLVLNPAFNNLVDGVNGNLVGAAYDPLFVTPAGIPPSCSGDFQLQAGSPAIDSGNNANAPVGSDFAGNLRINDGTVDMGAYEFFIPPPPPAPVPTMSQWALFLFGLIVTTLGIVTIYNFWSHTESQKA